MDKEQNLHRCHPFYGELRESSDLRVKIRSAVSDIALGVCILWIQGNSSTLVGFSPDLQLSIAVTSEIHAHHCHRGQNNYVSHLPQSSSLKFHPQGTGIGRWGPLGRPQMNGIGFSHERALQESAFSTSAGEKTPALARQTAPTCSLQNYIYHSI